jgi:spermidine synthase
MSNADIAVVGLGSGSISYYARPGQQFTFFEINPLVAKVAKNPSYFTYLSDCAGKYDIVLGDARAMIKRAPDNHFALIVLDAFNSDAIPMHLITREAIQIYLSKLRPHGIIAFHVTSWYVDLVPILTNLARDARLACIISDSPITAEQQAYYNCPATWIFLARSASDFGSFSANPKFRPAKDVPASAPWSDCCGCSLAL